MIEIVKLAEPEALADAVLGFSGVDLIVRVPMAAFDKGWSDLGAHLDPDTMDELGVEGIRLLGAAFCTLASCMPHYDVAAWSLRAGCANTVWDAAVRHFGKAELIERLIKAMTAEDLKDCGLERLGQAA